WRWRGRLLRKSLRVVAIEVGRIWSNGSLSPNRVMKMEMMEAGPAAHIEKNMEYINSFGYKIVQNMATERKLPANLKKMEMARLIALHNAGARDELNHLLNDLKETRSRTRRLALTHPAPSTPVPGPGYGTTTAEADSASASPDQDDDDDEYTFDEDEDDELIDKTKKTPRLPRAGAPQPRSTRVQGCGYGFDMASPSPPPTSTVNQGQGVAPAPGHSGIMPGGSGNMAVPVPRVGQLGPSGIPLPGPEETPRPKKPTYRRPSGGSSSLAVPNKRVSKGGRIIKPPRRDGSFVYPKMTYFQNSLPYPTARIPSPGFVQNGPGAGGNYDAPHISSATGGFRPPGQYPPAGSSLNNSSSLKSWSTLGAPELPLPSTHLTSNLYSRTSIPRGTNSKLCNGGLSATSELTQSSPYSSTPSGLTGAIQTQGPLKLTHNATRTIYHNYPAVIQNSDYKANHAVNSPTYPNNNYFQKGSEYSYLPNIDIVSSRLGNTNSVDNNFGSLYQSSSAVAPFESKRMQFAQMSSSYSQHLTASEFIMKTQIVKPIPLLLPQTSLRDCPPSGYISRNLEYFYNVKSEHLQMPLQLRPYWKPAKTNCVNSYNTPICFTSSSPGLHQEATHIFPNPLLSSGPSYEYSPFQPLAPPNFGSALSPTYDNPSNLSYEVSPTNFHSVNQSKQFLPGSQATNHVPSQYGAPQRSISAYQEPLQYQQFLCSNTGQYSPSPSVHDSLQDPNAWASPDHQVTQPLSHEREDSRYQPSMQPHQLTICRQQKPLQTGMHGKQIAQRKRPMQSHNYPQQTVTCQGNAHVQERRVALQNQHQSQHLSSLGKQDTDKIGVNLLSQPHEVQKHERNRSVFQHSNLHSAPHFNHTSRRVHCPNITEAPNIQRQGPPLKKPCYQSAKSSLQGTSVSDNSSKLSSPVTQAQQPSLPVSSSSEKPQLPFSEFRGQNNQLSFPLIYDYLTSTEKQLSSPKENHENLCNQPGYDLNGNISTSFIEDVVLPALSQHALNSKLQELVYQHENALEVSHNSSSVATEFSGDNNGQTLAAHVNQDYNMQGISQSLQVHQVSSLVPKSEMLSVSPDSSEQQVVEMSSIGLHFEPSKQVYPELQSPSDSNVNNENNGNANYVELLPVPFESNHAEESESQALRVAKAVTDLSLQPNTYQEGIALDITLEKIMNKDKNTKQVVFECTDGTGEPEYMTLDVSQEDALDTSVGTLPGTIPASPNTSDVGDLNLLDSVEESGNHSSNVINQESSHLSQVSTIPVSQSDLSTETASGISDYLSTTSPSQVTSGAYYLSTHSHLSGNQRNRSLSDIFVDATTQSLNSASQVIMDESIEAINTPEDVRNSIPEETEHTNLTDRCESAQQLSESTKRDDCVVPSVSGSIALNQNRESIHCQVPVALDRSKDLSEDGGSALRHVPSASEYCQLSAVDCRVSDYVENSIPVAINNFSSDSPFINNINSEVPELLQIIKTETVDVVESEENSENKIMVQPQNDDQLNELCEHPLELNVDCVNTTSDLCAEQAEETPVKDEPVDLTRDQTTLISETQCSKVLPLPTQENCSEASTDNSTNNEDESMNFVSDKSFDCAATTNLVSSVEDKPAMDSESDHREDNVHHVSPVLRSKSAGKTYPGKQVRQPVRCSPRNSGRPSPSYASQVTSALPFRSESPVQQMTRGRKQCPNEDNGCPIEVTSAQLMSHELLCEFKFIGCPAIGCEWNGIAKKLSSHIRENHRQAIGTGTDSKHTVSVHQIHQQQHLTFLREVSRKLFVVSIHAYGDDIYASIQYIASGRSEKPISATGTLEVIDFVGTPHAWRGMISPIQQGLKFVRESGNCLKCHAGTLRYRT
ncbi:E3 ubiquitin-protein ligase SINA-like 2, partial [Frankliniella fusca]